ncbi:MAG: type transport system permease protein, partial [Gaiellaceae bacterium]|nr:type transport system permease protein [Gaiellaceae bacterium]
MSSITVPAPSFPGRVTQARVVLSEWTKLRSVRSTRWSLLVATVLTIGFPILASALISSHWGSRSPGERASFNALDPALIGSQIAQLAIAVLGVLVITGEYSTGMIRASLTAVPKR